MIQAVILGIWDGHDAGAALLADSQIIVAINEERLSHKKLDIGFPRLSILECLRVAGLTPNDIECAAISTTDIAKTLTRCVPSLGQEYYLLRRKKKGPGIFSRQKKMFKYTLTTWSGCALSRLVSERLMRSDLRKLGMTPHTEWVDHHHAHAASAALCSGFISATVVTLDGIGDALSGSISTLDSGRLRRIAVISGRASFGVFFEHVTNLLNMRELEDEGKVMALSNYAFPVTDAENPLLGLFTIDGLMVRCKYSPVRLYRELSEVLYRFPSEQFAQMAQRVLEVHIPNLVEHAVQATGLRKVCLAGGVTSNVKLNMLIRALPCVESLFVFPHMGDGGLAVGAALAAGNRRFDWKGTQLKDLYLGTEFTEDEMQRTLQAASIPFERTEQPWLVAARAVAQRKTVLWYQGRMEYGPRALGHRSILARSDDPAARDRLNLQLKQRVWYQPFCPSILESDAGRYLRDYVRANLFMTEAYRTTAEGRVALAAAISVDGTCRPQIVKESDEPYSELIRSVRQLTGIGAVLNTSMNIHGDPMVNTPIEAIEVLRRSGADVLVMGPFVVAADRNPN